MMKSSSRLVKSGFAPALFAIVWPLSVFLVDAQRRQFSMSEERGKQIYLKGESERGEIDVVLGNGDIVAPARNFPCANCHGLRAEGSNEKGLQTPSIGWRALTAPRQSTPAWT